MIKYHHDINQGSDEWLAIRCGLVTASEMKHVVSKKTAKATGIVTWSAPENDKAIAHLYELAAQRISGYVEPAYIGDDMLRGMQDEVDAKTLYDKNYNKVESVGFITNDKWGFTLGYSPDGLIGDDGLIECKSRRQKYQIETIVTGEMPVDYAIQVQTGLLVSERKWLDFISYSSGLPMFVKRVLPDEVTQNGIIAAATMFHTKLNEIVEKWETAKVGFFPTERKIYEELII